MKKHPEKVVALVGRPNVGKSTLFNVLVGSRKALVENAPGLTRDRHYASTRIYEKSFTVVDTGGFEPTSPDVMLCQMRVQTMMAIEEADIVVFIVDGKTGLSPSDYEIADILRQTQKKVFYVVNKIDSEKSEHSALEFYSLGVDEIFSLSALTGYGVGDFLDALLVYIPTEPEIAEEPPESEERLIRVAIVGRPNVGKSTLINLFLGQERLVANPEPGTTRDPIDTIVKRDGKQYLFIDTAGIRRRSRISDRVEKYSVIKAFQSINRCDIAILILDSSELVTDQDARIAGYAFERGRGVIITLNKWDLITKDERTADRCVAKVREALKYLEYAPVVTISALRGTRAPRLFTLIDDLASSFRKRVSTGELNRFLNDLVTSNPPGMYRKTKRIKMYYGTQIRTRPPTFAFFCNYPEAIHFSYRRFLTNRLREQFDFGTSPLVLSFRKRMRREAMQRHG